MTEAKINIVFTVIMWVLLVVDIVLNRRLLRLLKEIKEDLFHE